MRSNYNILAIRCVQQILLRTYPPLEKERKVMRVFKEIRDYISDKVERLKISDLL